MVTLITNNGDTARFHYDNETEHRCWFAVKHQSGRFGYVTSFFRSEERKPGIPNELRGKAFGTMQEAIDAALSVS